MQCLKYSRLQLILYNTITGLEYKFPVIGDVKMMSTVNNKLYINIEGSIEVFDIKGVHISTLCVFVDILVTMKIFNNYLYLFYLSGVIEIYDMETDLLIKSVTSKFEFSRSNIDIY